MIEYYIHKYVREMSANPGRCVLLTTAECHSNKCSSDECPILFPYIKETC